MTRDDMEIVSALQDAVADKVGKERFSLWFAGTAQLRLEPNVLVVAAGDQFILDRVRHLFRKEVEAACREILGHAFAVDFRLDATLLTAPSSASGGSNGATINQPQQRPPKETQNPAAGRREPKGRRFESMGSFVVGDSNRLAFTAAAGAAARPGSVTPLFLYGPTGCGKTHLLEAVWTTVRKQSRNHRVVMLSAEQFTTYFLEALQGTGLPSFRRKYRHLDLLLIDDVHFFAGKRATLVELQHTIDTLLQDGKQIVLSADRPPSELHGLGKELIARMAGGLVCGIEAGDQSVRLGILKRWTGARGLNIPHNVLKMMAGELPGDARQLSGALNRLQATSQALDKPVTKDLAKTALADLFQAVQQMVRLNDVERAVCDVFGIEPKTLQSPRKSKSVSGPRMLAMWLARKYTRAALSEIGDYFGRRSHSTVISAQKKVCGWLSSGGQIQLAHGFCRVEDAIRRVEGKLRSG